MIKLKNGINPEILRKYGFKLGKEWFSHRRFGNGDGYQYLANDWFKFEMDPEEPEEILYADSDYDYAMVEISFKKFFNEENYYLDIDCAPSYTYHIGGSELKLIEDTLFDLITDGIVERIEK